MKYVKLFIVLAAVLCLDTIAKGDTKVNVDAFKNVVPVEDQVSETPFEWNFNLLWEVYLAMCNSQQNGDYCLQDEFIVKAIREESGKVYRRQFKKNSIHVSYARCECGGEDEMVCFKYVGEDKLYVFEKYEENCAGGCVVDLRSYSYDMKTKTFTEIEHPFLPLNGMDFFDELILVDCPNKIVSEEDSNSGEAVNLFEFDPDFFDCEFTFDFDEEEADMMVRFTGWNCPEKYERRGSRLAYDWDGNTFVRKPEADVMGWHFSAGDGFYSMSFGSKIPEKIEGFSVGCQLLEEDGLEWKETLIFNGWEEVMSIMPEYDDESGRFTNKVGIIDLYSSRYWSTEGLHVGSLVSDVLGIHTFDTKVILTKYGDIVIKVEPYDDHGMMFFVDKKDFLGKLPEITDGESAIIYREDLSFKPNARVNMIRLY